MTFMSKVVEQAAAIQLSGCRSAASSLVGVQTEALDRNCDVTGVVCWRAGGDIARLARSVSGFSFGLTNTAFVFRP